MPGSEGICADEHENRNVQEEESSSDQNTLRARAQQRIAYLKNQHSTYTTPLQETNQLEMTLFLQSFHNEISTSKQKRQRYKEVLAMDSDVARIFETLVVRRKVVTYEDFWERYEYRCDVSRVTDDLSHEDPPSAFLEDTSKTGDQNKLTMERVSTPPRGDTPPTRLSPSPFMIDVTENVRSGWRMSPGPSPFEEEVTTHRHSTPAESAMLEALDQALEAPGGREDASRLEEHSSLGHHLSPDDVLVREPQNLSFSIESVVQSRLVATNWSTKDEHLELLLEQGPVTKKASILDDDSNVHERDHTCSDGIQSEYVCCENKRVSQHEEVDNRARQLQAQARISENHENEAFHEISRRLEEAKQLEQRRWAEAMVRLEAAYHHDEQEAEEEEEFAEASLPIRTVETMDDEDEHIGDLTTSMEDFSFGDDSFDALLNSADQVLQNVRDDDAIDVSIIEFDISLQHSPEERNYFLSESRASENNNGFALGVHPLLLPAPRVSVHAEGARYEPTTYPSRKHRTNALITFGVCLFLVVSSIVVWARSNVPTGNFLCSPARPGSILSEASLTRDQALSATWWAPETLKEASFSVFCPSRTRTEIHAMKSNKGHLKIEILDTATKLHLFSWDRLRYFEIDSFGEKIHVDTPRGKRTWHVAPWGTQKEVDSA